MVEATVIDHAGLMERPNYIIENRDTFADRNQEATVWVGNIDSQVDEELLAELMHQAGPVKSINMPRDKVTGSHQGFAFVEFGSENDADYAMKVLNMVRLIGSTIKINKATREQGEQDIGANLFVGNLDPDVDEQLLFTTFSAFGQIIAAKVMYDEASGLSKGFGFVNYSDFNSADNAMKNMNGQFLCNRPISVSFAFKKGESGSSALRHGSSEERKIAALIGSAAVSAVHRNFAAAAPQPPPPTQFPAPGHAGYPPMPMPPFPMPMGMQMGMPFPFATMPPQFPPPPFAMPHFPPMQGLPQMQPGQMQGPQGGGGNGQ